MKIRRVVLECSQPASQLEFYTRVLGLPEERGALRVGRTLLEFVQGQAHRYHLAFAWPRNQWKAGVNWLGQRVPLLTGEEGQTHFEFDFWQARSVYFWDPAGNLLEAIVRDRLEEDRPQLEWLWVAEVGLVVEQVPRAVEQLNLPVFGPSRENFCALGGEDGLLILVEQGRTWYPTSDFLAASAPLWIGLENGIVEWAPGSSELPRFSID
jgi:catechol 2,3-dioxygenase-like lactoylglutathione lyase family enzyme